MNSSKDLQQNYGLDKIDTVVLRYLHKHQEQTPSQLAVALNLPRTTIAFRLQKLRERDFSEFEKIRNLTKWKLTTKGIQIFLKENKELEEVTLIKGMENIDGLIKSLADDYRLNRVYLFEPSVQTKYFVEKVNQEEFFQTNNLIKSHDIIVEAIIGEKTIEYAKFLNKEARKSMFGRPTIAYQLPDDVLNFKNIILCFDVDTYLIDYKGEKVVHIHNKEVTESYRSIFEHYKLHSKRVDLNSAVQSV